MEETKRRKIRIEAGGRAIQYKNRIREQGPQLLVECLKERAFCTGMGAER